MLIKSKIKKGSPFTKKALLILLFTLLIMPGYSQSNCESLNNYDFPSYEEAIKKINNTHFVFSETVNTSKSSWVRGASFYSCDKIVGYFILTTDKRSYVYKNRLIHIIDFFYLIHS